MPKDGRADGEAPSASPCSPLGRRSQEGSHSLLRCCFGPLGTWASCGAQVLREVRSGTGHGLQRAAVGGRRSPATGTEARQHLWHTAGAELRAPEPTALLQSASRLLWQHLLCAKRATGRQLPGGTVAGAASGAPSEPGSVFPLGSASFCTASPSAPSARKRHSCTGSNHSSAGGCF